MAERFVPREKLKQQPNVGIPAGSRCVCVCVSLCFVFPPLNLFFEFQWRKKKKRKCKWNAFFDTDYHRVFLLSYFIFLVLRYLYIQHHAIVHVLMQL